MAKILFATVFCFWVLMKWFSKIGDTEPGVRIIGKFKDYWVCADDVDKCVEGAGCTWDWRFAEK